jgi:hypothetical protein
VCVNTFGHRGEVEYISPKPTPTVQVRIAGHNYDYHPSQLTLEKKSATRGATKKVRAKSGAGATKQASVKRGASKRAASVAGRA